MRSVTIFVLVVCFFLVSTVAASADWKKGIIHNHSDYSDGFWTPRTIIGAAEKSHLDYLIQTDHYEQINTKFREGFVKLRHGYEGYYRDFASNNILIIHGAEIQSRWGLAYSHTLVLGDLVEDIQLNNLQDKQGTQQQIINRIHQLGYLSVAAHPNWVMGVIPIPDTFEGVKKCFRGDNINYMYDPDHAQGINGVEFFNDGDRYASTLRWYLHLIYNNKKVFVTSGCDKHNVAIDLENGKRWQRITYVNVDRQLNRNSLLEAIAAGQTYAARDGASLRNLNLTPGFTRQNIDSPKIICEFIFAEPFGDTKTLNIYRNGNSKPVYQAVIPKFARSYQLNWQDQTIKAGFNTYILEVEKTLITSPIMVNLSRKQKSGYMDWYPKIFDHNMVFISDRSGSPALYIADLNTLAVRKIINLKDCRVCYSLSLNGNILIADKTNRLIVVLFENGKFQPYNTNIIINEENYFASWQGTNRFTFLNQAGVVNGAIILSTNQEEDIQLFDLFKIKQRPYLNIRVESYNSKNRLYSIVKDKFGYEQIWLIDRNLNRDIQITFDRANHMDAIKSAFSGSIQAKEDYSFLCSTDKGGKRNVYIYRFIKGRLKSIKQLTNNGADNYEAFWSNNEKLIYYVSNVTGANRIWVMNSDGSNKRELFASG